MKRFLWSGVGLLAAVTAGCGDDDGAAVDSGTAADAGVDASPPTDGGGELDAALEECAPEFEPWGRVFVDFNSERIDEWYEMTVVAVHPDGFDLWAPPVLEDDLTVEARFPVPEGETLDLVTEGETVLARGGTCDGGSNSGYVRITDTLGEIIWEGGDPHCDEWAQQFYFALEEIPGAIPCWWTHRGPRPPPECCCPTRTDWQVVFVFEDPPRPMAPGESTIVSSEGRRYYAASQGGYQTLNGPCTFDLNYWYGSAFLARLAD